MNFFHWNSNIFIEENAFEIVFCEMLATLSWPQCVKRRNPWSILAIKKFFILGCSLCYILLLVTRSLVAVHRCPIFCRPSLVTNASECTLKRRRWWLKLRRPLTPTVSEKTWRNKWSVYIFYCMDWLGGNWNFDGLVQDCSNSSMLTMELLQSCIKPSICAHGHYYHYCLGETEILTV